MQDVDGPGEMMSHGQPQVDLKYLLDEPNQGSEDRQQEIRDLESKNEKLEQQVRLTRLECTHGLGD